MNKGLEVIEAHHLFALKSKEIDVLVHPQSIIHGLVEFRDGSLIAQLGSPDMRIPIAHCLAWPEERLCGPAPRLDLAQAATLTFEEPDLERFPALRLARSARGGGRRPNGTQCRQRGRSRGIPGAPARICWNCRPGRIDAFGRNRGRPHRGAGERGRSARHRPLFEIIGPPTLARNCRKGILGWFVRGA
jgi:hypothetical protein